MKYEKTLPISGQNDTTISTYSGTKGKEGNITYSSDSLTSFDNVASGNISYYKTTITNSAASDTRVGLYLNNMSNTKAYVGTSSPVWNEKNYVGSPQRQMVSTGIIRVYFQPKDWASKNGKYYAFCCTTNGKVQTYSSELILCSDYKGEHKTYYADIPDNSEELFFSRIDNFKAGNDDRTQAIVGNENHTAAGVTVSGFSKLWKEETQCIVYYTDGDKSNTVYGNSYNNMLAKSGKLNGDGSKGACVKKYSESVSLSKNATVSIVLGSGDYTGNTVTYKSNNANIAAVDSSGKITAKGTGNTSITTTVTGNYQDKYEVYTNVSVYASGEAVPVVQNVKIPAGQSVDICWYIKNDTGSVVSFDGLMLTL